MLVLLLWIAAILLTLLFKNMIEDSKDSTDKFNLVVAYYLGFIMMGLILMYRIVVFD